MIASSKERPRSADPAPEAAERIHVAIVGSAIGRVLVATSEQGICALLPGDDDAVLRQALEQRFPQAILLESVWPPEEWLSQVAAFLDDPRRGLMLPLDLRGTPFQQRVWEALRRIPAGDTASYTDIACRIGSPRAVRAVARACATNPLAVVVPCHRVLRRDGGISGYRWGVERKRLLLEREARLSR